MNKDQTQKRWPVKADLVNNFYKRLAQTGLIQPHADSPLTTLEGADVVAAAIALSSDILYTHSDVIKDTKATAAQVAISRQIAAVHYLLLMVLIRFTEDDSTPRFDMEKSA